MKNRRMIVMACGTALLIAVVVAVVVASRNRQPVPPPPPEVPVAVSTDKVRVNAVERKDESVAQGESAAATDAVAAYRDVLRPIEVESETEWRMYLDAWMEAHHSDGKSDQAQRANRAFYPR